LKDIMRKRLLESAKTLEKTAADDSVMENAGEFSRAVIRTYAAGGKVMIAGNGGSAADAQHIAAELVARFYFDREGLWAEALTVNSSVLTAVANDYDYESIFSRQIESNGRPGDLFIAISTSGNSPNIVKAVRTCGEKGIYTVGLLGRGGGKLSSICDLNIIVPSDDTPRIQETHIALAHAMCEIVEQTIFGENA